MTCEKCGAELKEGCLYCSVCGYEVQMVSEYTVLEDDYLSDLINHPDSGTKAEKKDEPQKEKKAGMSKEKKKKIIKIVSFVALFVLLVTALGVKLYIDDKNAHSYDYQVHKAEEEMSQQYYQNALDYYQNALSIQPDDVPVRLAMANIYMIREDYSSAQVLCMEVIRLDKTNLKAYQNLISIYELKQDYESIITLAEDVTDSDVLELFADYLVSDPIFSPDGGQYDDYKVVKISADDDCKIYYTLDGTEPETEGKLYEAGISLDSPGLYMIKAVSCNPKGIYSKVVEVSYQIDIPAPRYPIVTPDGGNFTEETTVTIQAEEDNCSIYYTWNGTDPTTNSSQYKGPITVPEGNNVLSVIVVDNHTEYSSEVYRANFIFYEQ